MFKCGELIVYGNNGVCRIEEITTLNSDTADKGRLYYVLKNLTSNGIAYIPVDSNVYMRPVMSRIEADRLIDKIPLIDTSCFDKVSPRELQKVYRDVLLSHNSELTVSLIKHILRTERLKQIQKKKLSATEERYLEQAIKIIGSEFATALNIDFSEVKQYILNRIGTENM